MKRGNYLVLNTQWLLFYIAERNMPHKDLDILTPASY